MKVIFKATLYLFLFLILNGCTVIGGFVDTAVFDGKVKFFQSYGEHIDKQLYTSDAEKFANEKALERNCKYGKEELETCERINKQNESDWRKL